MRFFDRPFVVPSLIASIALIIGLWIVGWGISSRGQDNIITTTGSASRSATADNATWIINLQRTSFASSVAADSSRVSNEAAAIAEYFRKQNLASSTVTVAAVSAYQNYSSDRANDSYTVNGSVTVTTSDVEAMDRMSHSISALSALVSSGTVVSPSQPQYFISDLSSMRVSLLGDAITDAKARAQQIAKNGGGTVGPLRTASSGVVQVLAPNSTNVEDYGQYDTSTIQKEVMVTVRASFYIR